MESKKSNQYGIVLESSISSGWNIGIVKGSEEQYLIHHIQKIPSMEIEGVEVSRAILGCDSFISWLYQGGSSPFKGENGNLNVSKVFEVMKTCVSCGVTSLDLAPPVFEAFRRLNAESDEEITGVGALQEWACENFTIDGIPLRNCSEEIKAIIRLKLPQEYLEHLAKSKKPESDFIRSFFMPKRSTRPLARIEIDKITMNPEFFEKRLKLYRSLGVKLVQFGGLTADWLVSMGRVDLLERLSKLIRSHGFIPILICHWTSIVLPVAEKEIGVAGYIAPLNKSWGLLTLRETLDVIKNVEKPIIAMKTLGQGALAHDLHGAFTFVFKEARVSAALVGVSSKVEAEQTFSALAKVLAQTE